MHSLQIIAAVIILFGYATVFVLSKTTYYTVDMHSNDKYKFE